MQNDALKVKKRLKGSPHSAARKERPPLLAEEEAAVPAPPTARGRAIILLSFVLIYTLGCGFTAFHLDGQQQRWNGVQVLVFGLAGLKMMQFAWLANITVIVALRAVMQGQTRTAQIWSVVSLLLALHTFALFGQEISLGRQDFNTVRLVSLGAGYYLWLLALLLPLIITLLRRFNTKFRRRHEFAG